MINETLNMWGKGAVTLPKEWRNRWGTKHFLAEENEFGFLVIKPVLGSAIMYYEDGEGAGLRFPFGMPAETFFTMWNHAEAKIGAAKTSSKRQKHRKSRK